ncbi:MULTISPECIES: MarR family transcriptional regulator [unclassified Chelatococcus]|nr:MULTISPECIES: MarR family transcriptional regulator [unclassified Chelatococcus]MBS7738994.1 MarR family transcriptional regulator [Chelatococcus sp. HY11]MBX3543427.1 MarR family transcriptional regulator [Chelatococcus sp.]MCO5076476.1 MarR family transcriptional regulator [Chelatococcus sp.]
MPLPDDLSQCLVLNTVAAARSLLRRNDAKLKPFGVTVQQFSLLAAIRFHPDEPVATLAQRVLLDRTSLTRNLDRLERKGLMRRIEGKAGNARVCELTEQGNLLLDRLLPEWQRSRGKLMEGLSDEDVGSYLRVSRRLTQE